MAAGGVLVVMIDIKQEPLHGLLSPGWLTSLLRMKGFVLGGDEWALHQFLPVRPIK